MAHASIPLASLHGADPLPPYVRLIHDVLLGDRSLFTRPDGLAAVWDVAEPLLAKPPTISTYPPGSWGQRSPRADRAGTLAPRPVGGPLASWWASFSLDRPGWLDWPWVLRVLDQEVRVTGEKVRLAEGQVATACLVAGEPLIVTVTGGTSQLTVRAVHPSAW